MSTITVRLFHHPSRTPIAELQGLDPAATLSSLRTKAERHLAAEEACMMRAFDKWHVEVFVAGCKRVVELTAQDEASSLSSLGIEDYSEVLLEGPLTWDLDYGTRLDIDTSTPQPNVKFEDPHTAAKTADGGGVTLRSSQPLSTANHRWAVRIHEVGNTMYMSLGLLPKLSVDKVAMMGSTYIDDLGGWCIVQNYLGNESGSYVRGKWKCDSVLFGRGDLVLFDYSFRDKTLTIRCGGRQVVGRIPDAGEELYPAFSFHKEGSKVSFEKFSRSEIMYFLEQRKEHISEDRGRSASDISKKLVNKNPSMPLKALWKALIHDDFKGSRGCEILMAIANLCGKECRSKISERDMIHNGKTLKFGATPLILAAHAMRTDVVIMMMRAGADTQAQNISGCTALHAAVAQDDLATATVLLNPPSSNLNDNAAAANFNRFESRPADVNAADSDGNAPLHLARSIEMARLLVNRGANVNAVNVKNYTPLHLFLTSALPSSNIGAQNATRSNIAQLLIELGANIHALDRFGRTPLHLAVAARLNELVTLLLEKGANVESRDKAKQTALHIAAENGDDASIRTLSDLSSIEAQDTEGNTAMHLASRGGHFGTVSLLVRKGANIESRTKEGRTPLHVAVEEGHIDVVKVLIGLGADAQSVTHPRQESIAHLAATKGHEGILLYLLGSSFDINQTDGHGNTPLHFAVHRRHLLVVQQLIRSGANIDRTSLHVAAATGWNDVIKYFIAEGGLLDARDIDGRTALHWAAEAGHVQIVESLVDVGADTTVTDAQHQTPAQLAASNGHSAIVAFIRKG